MIASQNYRRAAHETRLLVTAQLYQNGSSLREIAKITGYSHVTVREDLKKQGIPLRARSYRRPQC